MTNIVLVNRKNENVGFADYMTNLTSLVNSVEDKADSIIVCDRLPAEWSEGFRSLGQADDIFVAFVQFALGEETINMGFIGWDRDLMLKHVRHVGEEIAGGTLASFEPTGDIDPDGAHRIMGMPKPTIH